MSTSVEYIHMSKSEMELEVNTYAVVHATAMPVDATNRTLCYESDRPDIVSMNTSNGQVRANKIGTAVITVYLQSDPSIKATCTITVKGYIPVESISFLVTDYTLKLNNTMKLGARIQPTNATNPKVTWWSCCPAIATVDSDGTVRPKSPGSVDIYASAENGSLTAKCTIRVVIDNVTIKQNGGITEVVFESTGKTWKHIGFDMLYGTSEIDTGFLVDRCNFNYFETVDTIYSDVKEFSNEELKFLYAIDPYGVAEYIYRYADRIIRAKAIAEGKDSLEERVKYKDNIFKVIFEREPKYYKRIATNTYEWVETTDTSDIETVFSESESLFGIRQIHDDISKYIKTEAGWNFITACIKAAIGMSQVGTVLLTTYDLLVNTCQIVSTTSQEKVLNKLLKSYSKTGAETIISLPDMDNVEYNKYNIIGWANALVTGIGGLNDILNTTIVGKDFCEEITYYYADSSKYNVSLVLNNGDKYYMNNIYDALKILNN